MKPQNDSLSQTSQILSHQEECKSASNTSRSTTSTATTQISFSTAVQDKLSQIQVEVDLLLPQRCAEQNQVLVEQPKAPEKVQKKPEIPQKVVQQPSKTVHKTEDQTKVNYLALREIELKLLEKSRK